MMKHYSKLLFNVLTPLFRPMILVLAVIIATGLSQGPAYAQRSIPCNQLVNLHLPDTTITSAVNVGSGGPIPTDPDPGRVGDPNQTCSSYTAFDVLPAFCRVSGTIGPGNIKFEVWLPPEYEWNGRFMMYGNHGNAGYFNYGDMAPQLLHGYAIAGTDTGHTRQFDSFPYNPFPIAWTQDPQALIDYGYRSVHEVTVKAKEIVRAYYGRRPWYSYWSGCSTGGNEGLKEVQRYPEDYDGVIVGDPNNFQVDNRVSFVWDAQVTFADPGTNLTNDPGLLQRVNAAVLDECDGIDGVVDGVIDDPRLCNICTNGRAFRAKAGLTHAQAGALQDLYEGPGENIYVGYPKGSELAFPSVIRGPRALSSADLFFRNIVFHDPNWDFRTLNYSDNLAAARVFSPLFDAVDTDLSAFKNLGGKLLHYHNWGSSSHAAGQSIKYYEDVEAEMGKGTEHFYRLFMVPGGSGSNAPTTFDPVPIMEQWVERGKAPEEIIASHLTATGEVDRTRPLCPYPKFARYKGTGSTDDAANFRCVDPDDDHDGNYDRWGWKEWRKCGKSKEHSD